MLLNRLSTCSKRAFRKKWRRGKPVTYYLPQERLLKRLVSETGLTEQEVITQLQKEWKLLQQQEPTILPVVNY